MLPDQSLAATAVQAWTLHVRRAEKTFLGRTDEALRKEIAPGKNRLVYLFGHTAHMASHLGQCALISPSE